MKTFEEKFDDYAKLVVDIGVNVQEGEPVIITCPVERADFARALAKHSYIRGASEVVMNWTDDTLTLLKYENAPMEVLENIPDWAYDRSEYYLKKGVNRISVYAEDPNLLKDIDINRIEKASKARSIKFKPLVKYTMNDIVSWCVVSVPTKAWAKAVFPDLNEDEAYEKLWDLILDVTRMNDEDPIKSWSEHINNLDKKSEYLNEAQFDSLHYKSENGTDITIGLPEGHIWMSAGSTNAKATVFVPNIPTEEVFTLPHRQRVDGIIYSTKPLAYNGTVIDEFWLKFEKGEVVDFDAKKGRDSLEALLNQDENSKRLGEVALVPYDSPISNSNVLFFNTLFDENASCHLAFGEAYPTTLKGGVDMDDEELLKNGVNRSLIHEDFMVGSKDLEITGIKKDGSQIKIFENGNWAI